MANILNRPLFRRGASTNEGIMHGLVDRRGYAVGDRILEAKEWLSKIPQPRDTSLSEMLVGGGLNLMSGQGAGSGLMANIGQSFKGPSETYFKRAGERRGYQSDLDMAATKMGLEQDWAERLAKAKAAGTGTLQKDYSTDRKYFELVKAYTEAPKDRYSKTITNIYPHGMAEFGSRIQDNAYKTEEGAAFMQDMNGIVPHQIKSGAAEWDYNKMDAGAYYYHPGLKAFVQRQPRTEDTPAQIIILDPYTFKEVRRQNLE